MKSLPISGFRSEPKNPLLTLFSEKEIIFVDQRTLEHSETTCDSLCQDSLYYKDQLLCLLSGEIMIFKFDTNSYELSDIQCITI